MTLGRVGQHHGASGVPVAGPGPGPGSGIELQVEPASPPASRPPQALRRRDTPRARGSPKLSLVQLELSLSPARATLQPPGGALSRPPPLSSSSDTTRPPLSLTVVVVSRRADLLQLEPFPLLLLPSHSASLGEGGRIRMVSMMIRANVAQSVVNARSERQLCRGGR